MSNVTEQQVQKFIRTYQINKILLIWHADKPNEVEKLKRWFDNTGDPVLYKLKCEGWDMSILEVS